ncbi:MAG TPA: hypothetical protein VGM25_16760, partial [Caulobacteraceae bacterium]
PGGGAVVALRVGGAGGQGPEQIGVRVAGHALTTSELPAHTHGVTDSGHSHGVTDGGHSHGLTDPSHTHTITQNLDNNGPMAANHGLGNVSGQVEIATTTSDPAATGITVDSATTGVAVNGAATGVTIQNTGGGAAHAHDASAGAVPTVPPFAAVNYIIKA